MKRRGSMWHSSRTGSERRVTCHSRFAPLFPPIDNARIPPRIADLSPDAVLTALFLRGFPGRICLSVGDRSLHAGEFLETAHAVASFLFFASFFLSFFLSILDTDRSPECSSNCEHSRDRFCAILFLKDIELNLSKFVRNIVIR